MDRILSVVKHTRDDIITPWMHTYSRLVRAGYEETDYDESDAQTDN